ncbi:hypothetical protein CN311_15970 [Mesorhizobium sanjuanii]|uniref:ATP-dependent DNA helicase RecQ n=1 Tax=Mesorhizobium sanjuanii TaxID=2037900 RepID=A0A2A6FEF7_9HYPH|nr:hypothetical protein CN311_15970 [Mesorhizobium sanjuanii]
MQSEHPADAVLLRHTPYPFYRTAAQKAGLRALLTMPDGGALMVSMPTGSGKSLLFQLDALRSRASEPNSCSVVITPTVSLALDHARTLSKMPGLEHSQALIGDMKDQQRDELLNAFRRGEIPILIMSPEFAFGAARSALIEAAMPAHAKATSLKAKLRSFVIDEAHIIESWGRGFRPDFQRLPGLLAELRQSNPALNLLLLSATLPQSARRILRGAYASTGPWLEVDAATARYEFDLVVQSYVTAEERQAALDFVIDRVPRPMILYTTLAAAREGDEADKRRDERVSAEDLHRRLVNRGYERIALFTGQVTSTQARRRIVDDWADEKIDIVVATSAFGMGIDKANVRSVVHACLPEGPSRWYQEIGRAARDGHQGLAVCLFTRHVWKVHSDVSTAYSQALGSWLTRELAEPRWQALLQSRSQPRWEAGRQRMRLDLDAEHEGIKRTRWRKSYNREWNMALINLMQRAGVLEVLSVDTQKDDGAVWDVEIKEPGLLEPDSVTLWDRIFTLRNAERAVAKSELDAFVGIMSKAVDHCLISDVFAMIEHEAGSDVARCGRCPGCRAHSETPPRSIRCMGLERAWPGGPRTGPILLPLGATLVVPADPTYEKGLERLVLRLASVGIEQFVVPDALAPEVAHTLAGSTERLGLVLSHGELIGEAQVVLAGFATAVLMPSEAAPAAALLQRCLQWIAARPALPLLVVARPEQEIRERRLDQLVSRQAPYDEAVLDSLSASGGLAA